MDFQETMEYSSHATNENSSSTEFSDCSPMLRFSHFKSQELFQIQNDFHKETKSETSLSDEDEQLYQILQRLQDFNDPPKEDQFFIIPDSDTNRELSKAFIDYFNGSYDVLHDLDYDKDNQNLIIQFLLARFSKQNDYHILDDFVLPDDNNFNQVEKKLLSLFFYCKAQNPTLNITSPEKLHYLIESATNFLQITSYPPIAIYFPSFSLNSLFDQLSKFILSSNISHPKSYEFILSIRSINKKLDIQNYDENSSFSDDFSDLAIDKPKETISSDPNKIISRHAIPSMTPLPKLPKELKEGISESSSDDDFFASVKLMKSNIPGPMPIQLLPTNEEPTSNPLSEFSLPQRKISSITKPPLPPAFLTLSNSTETNFKVTHQQCSINDTATQEKLKMQITSNEFSNLIINSTFIFSNIPTFSPETYHSRNRTSSFRRSVSKRIDTYDDILSRIPDISDSISIVPNIYTEHTFSKLLPLFDYVNAFHPTPFKRGNYFPSLINSIYVAHHQRDNEQLFSFIPDNIQGTPIPSKETEMSFPIRNFPSENSFDSEDLEHVLALISLELFMQNRSPLTGEPLPQVPKKPIVSDHPKTIWRNESQGKFYNISPSSPIVAPKKSSVNQTLNRQSYNNHIEPIINENLSEGAEEPIPELKLNITEKPPIPRMSSLSKPIPRGKFLPMKQDQKSDSEKEPNLLLTSSGTVPIFNLHPEQTHPATQHRWRQEVLYSYYIHNSFSPYVFFKLAYALAGSLAEDGNDELSVRFYFEAFVIISKFINKSFKLPIVRQCALALAEKLAKSGGYWYSAIIYDCISTSVPNENSIASNIAQTALQHRDAQRAVFHYIRALKEMIIGKRVDEALFLGRMVAGIYCDHGLPSLAVGLLLNLLKNSYQISTLFNKAKDLPNIPKKPFINIKDNMIFSKSIEEFAPAPESINTIIAANTLVDLMIKSNYFSAAALLIQKLEEVTKNQASTFNKTISFSKANLYFKQNLIDEMIHALPNFDFGRAFHRAIAMNGAGNKMIGQTDMTSAAFRILCRGLLNRERLPEAFFWSETYILSAPRGSKRDVAQSLIYRAYSLIGLLRINSFPLNFETLLNFPNSDANQSKNPKNNNEEKAPNCNGIPEINFNFKFNSLEKATFAKMNPLTLTKEECIKEALGSLLLAHFLFDQLGSLRKLVLVDLVFTDLLLHSIEECSLSEITIDKPKLSVELTKKKSESIFTLQCPFQTRKLTLQDAEKSLCRAEKQCSKLLLPAYIIYAQSLRSKFDYIKKHYSNSIIALDFAAENFRTFFSFGSSFILKITPISRVRMLRSSLDNLSYVFFRLTEVPDEKIQTKIVQRFLVLDWYVSVDLLLSQLSKEPTKESKLQLKTELEPGKNALRILKDEEAPDFKVTSHSTYDGLVSDPEAQHLAISANIRIFETGKLTEQKLYLKNGSCCHRIKDMVASYQKHHLHNGKVPPQFPLHVSKEDIDKYKENQKKISLANLLKNEQDSSEKVKRKRTVSQIDFVQPSSLPTSPLASSHEDFTETPLNSDELLSMKLNQIDKKPKMPFGHKSSHSFETISEISSPISFTPSENDEPIPKFTSSNFHASVTESDSENEMKISESVEPSKCLSKSESIHSSDAKSDSMIPLNEATNSTESLPSNTNDKSKDQALLSAFAESDSDNEMKISESVEPSKCLSKSESIHSSDAKSDSMIPLNETTNSTESLPSNTNDKSKDQALLSAFAESDSDQKFSKTLPNSLNLFAESDSENEIEISELVEPSKCLSKSESIHSSDAKSDNMITTNETTNSTENLTSNVSKAPALLSAFAESESDSDQKVSKTLPNSLNLFAESDSDQKVSKTLPNSLNLFVESDSDQKVSKTLPNSLNLFAESDSDQKVSKTLPNSLNLFAESDSENEMEISGLVEPSKCLSKSESIHSSDAKSDSMTPLNETTNSTENLPSNVSKAPALLSAFAESDSDQKVSKTSSEINANEPSTGHLQNHESHSFDYPGISKFGDSDSSSNEFEFSNDAKDIIPIPHPPLSVSKAPFNNSVHSLTPNRNNTPFLKIRDRIQPLTPPLPSLHGQMSDENFQFDFSGIAQGAVYILRLFNHIAIYLPGNINGQKTRFMLSDSHNQPINKIIIDATSYYLGASDKKIKQDKPEFWKSVNVSLFGNLNENQESPLKRKYTLVPDKSTLGQRGFGNRLKGALLTINPGDSPIVVISTANIGALPFELIFHNSLVLRSMSLFSLISAESFSDKKLNKNKKEKSESKIATRQGRSISQRLSNRPSIEIHNNRIDDEKSKKSKRRQSEDDFFGKISEDHPKIISFRMGLEGPENGIKIGSNRLSLLLSCFGVDVSIPNRENGQIAPMPFYAPGKETSTYSSIYNFCTFFEYSLNQELPKIKGIKMLFLSYPDICCGPQLISKLLHTGVYVFYIPPHVSKDAFKELNFIFKRQEIRKKFVLKDGGGDEEQIQIASNLLTFASSVQITLIDKFHCPIGLYIPSQ